MLAGANLYLDHSYLGDVLAELLDAQRGPHGEPCETFRVRITVER